MKNIELTVAFNSTVEPLNEVFTQTTYFCSYINIFIIYLPII